jgi:uncharacterized membrane protein
MTEIQIIVEKMVTKLYKFWGNHVENLPSAMAMRHGIDAFHRELR